jgi:uncharacterized membrane protein
MMSRITKRRQQIRNMVLVALLAALVVIFQSLSNVIKVGPIAITLTLIPVVLGGCLLGKKWGAILGFLFGVIVSVFVFTGIDAGGYILFTVNPIITILLCLFKGTAAGLAAAWSYELLAGENRTVATAVAAMVAPVVNTSLFVLGMFLFYTDILAQWAGGQNVMIYIITGLAGWNFVFEFAAAVIVTPVITTVIRVTKRK